MRIALVADRIGWEERQLLAAAGARGIAAAWADDGSMCLGPAGPAACQADVFLIRSRSYVRSHIVASLLADRGARVVNSPASIAVCADKLATARTLRAAGLPVLDFRVVLSRDDLAQAIDQLGLPCVIKPLSGGFGRRVMLIRDRDIAAAAYDYVDHFGQGLDRVLLAQPYHPGRDERVIVVGPTVLAAYTRIPDGDWRANVAVGAEVRAVPVTDETRELCRSVSRAIGAEIYAVDLFADAAGKVINEVNHVPRYRGAAETTAASIDEAIIDYLSAGVLQGAS